MKTGFWHQERNDDANHFTAMVPTLFIGIGGTGFEVLKRLHRQYLSQPWDDLVDVRVPPGSPKTEFAQFLCIDGEKHGSVSVHEAVPALHMVEPPDNTHASFAAFVGDMPDSIRKWYPLSDGASMPRQGASAPWLEPSRALSRLCFHWMYPAIKKALHDRLTALMRAVDVNGRAKVRIVVVCSLYGYSGSAWCADTALLTRVLADEMPYEPIVDLYAVPPQNDNLQHEANAYAALMELETLMQTPSHYVAHCCPDQESPSERSFDNIYLFDSSNVAGEKLNGLQDLYQMMAETLLHDFQCRAMRESKARLAFLRNRATVSGFVPKYDNEYKHLSLTYSSASSALGRFTIDMHLEAQNKARMARGMSKMLERYFGIADDDDYVRPTDLERNRLMAECLFLQQTVFSTTYQAAGKLPAGVLAGWEQSMPVLVAELLRLDGKILRDDLTAKARACIQQFGNDKNCAEWPDKIQVVMQQLERDVFGEPATGPGIYETAIAQRRGRLFAELTAADAVLVRALSDQIDNNELGGINRTLALLEVVKDAIDHPQTGWLRKLEELGKRFETFGSTIASEEIPALVKQLRQARWLPVFGSEGNMQARMARLGQALAYWIEGRLHALACREAARLLGDLSTWLGNGSGSDPRSGEAVSQGFIGELIADRQQVRALVGLIQTEAEAAEREMETDHPNHAALLKSGIQDSLHEGELSWGEAEAWIAQAFGGLHRKSQMIKRLATPEGRAQLLVTLWTVASRERSAAKAATVENPLFEALRAHPDRPGLFHACLRRALPWVNADLKADFAANANPYVCLVGVRDAAQFDREFGDEFRKAAPTVARFSDRSIIFVETSVPGRLSCHMELSGLPFTAMRRLPEWRQSYDKRYGRPPVNIHRKASVFRHPLAPTAQDLTRLEEDLRTFLAAVACGVLHRRPGDETYELNERGIGIAVGSEQQVRMRGLSGENKDMIEAKLNDQSEKIRDRLQLAALCILFEHYMDHTYPAKRVTRDDCDGLEYGLAYLACGRLREKYLNMFQATAAGKLDSIETLTRLRTHIDQWSAVIVGSEEDGYQHEVGGDAGPKRAVLPQFFDSHWLGQAIDRPRADPGFYVAADGAAAGPYSVETLAGMAHTRALTAQSWVCPVGGAQWVAASTVPELASLPFSAVPPPWPT